MFLVLKMLCSHIFKVAAATLLEEFPSTLLYVPNEGQRSFLLRPYPLEGLVVSAAHDFS